MTRVQRRGVGLHPLLETCKMNGVEPHAWLENTLEKIAAGHPQSQIHELPPRNFDPASS